MAGFVSEPRARCAVTNRPKPFAFRPAKIVNLDKTAIHFGEFLKTDILGVRLDSYSGDYMAEFSRRHSAFAVFDRRTHAFCTDFKCFDTSPGHHIDALLLQRFFDECRNVVIFDRDDPVIFNRLVMNMRFAGAGEERDAGELYLEARELGMHLTDIVVRRRLVQRMRLLIESRAAEPESPSPRAKPPSCGTWRPYLSE